MIGKIGKTEKIEKDKKELKKENLSKNKKIKKGKKSMLKKGIISVVLCFLTIGCEGDHNIMSPEINEEFLEVYSTQEMDKNGYYHYPYTGYNYGSIYFETTPTTLVGWTSPDEFCVQFFEELICEPVINYQTYSREDGSGQQNFYMSEEFIGDTLNLVGYLNTEVVKEIKVIIK